MPRRHRDPIVGVLDYFRTAPPEAAKIALALATEEIAKRTPIEKKKPTPARRAGPGPAPATVGE